MEHMHTYRVIITPDDGVYHACVPALPGCHTWGATVEEARAMIRDAIDLYVRSCVADGVAKF
jgi:antitoxin HicB